MAWLNKTISERCNLQRAALKKVNDDSNMKKGKDSLKNVKCRKDMNAVVMDDALDMTKGSLHPLCVQMFV